MSKLQLFNAQARRLWRTLLPLAGSAVLLVWLFAQADDISIEQHHAYSGRLLRLLQTDAEFNSALLANRYGLVRDFDRISLDMRRLQEVTESLTEVPAFVPDVERRLMELRIAELQDIDRLKDQALDRFKREISLLHNSLSYFPQAIDTLIVEARLDPALSREVGIFGRSLMSWLQSDDEAIAERLGLTLERLETVAPGLPARPREQLQSTLAHARILMERTPAINAITREILAMPTRETGNELNRLYAQGYNRASHHAWFYRVLLFMVALGLAGYLALMIVRQRQTARALAEANLSLNDRLEALHLAQDELRRYATVFTNAREGMMITDADASILAVNPAFTDITGYALAEVAGRNPSLLASGRQEPSWYQAMWEQLLSQGNWQGEVWNRRRDGEIYPQWLSIAAVRDDDGRTTHYIGIFSDVSERKKAEAHIRHLAHHDALTGLPNRLLLQDRLEQAISQAKRQDRLVAVLYFDLDRFKIINDSLGHEVGDGLLRTVTQRCLAAVRETDTVARQGGDEFVVVLPELAQAQDAGLIASQILAAVTRPCHLDQHELTVTCSIGIALYPNDGNNGSILLRNADAAMYRAKANGRNGFEFYTADMSTASLGELLLEHQLRGALERDELRLFYQPRVESVSGRMVGCEALLRWQHPEQGLLGPDRFIPAAEESGLIVAMGQWVIHEACRQMRAWLDQGLTVLPVAVNLSAQQLTHQDLVVLVREALAEHRLAPCLLELELTETMLMRDVGRTIPTLAELSDMGVSLAIDDFGTGYSSLGYLRQFRVNSLKIDRSFVNDIFLGANDAKIATAVIALAHSLGLQVTAEGVETEEQREFLAAHRCDFLQGYLFGRPESADTHARRLARSLPAPAPA